MNWYAAHVVMYVKLKSLKQNSFPIWENIVLIRAESEDEAFAKAEARGREDEGDDDGSFRWKEKPAEWVFAGVRKLTLCQDAHKRPGDGTEISYTEMSADSEQSVRKLAQGQGVSLRHQDDIGIVV